MLVNNAGIALDKFVSPFQLSFDTLKKTIDTNVYGVFLVTKAFAPLMTSGGHIVMVSSMHGSLRRMGKSTLAYRMSKTSVNAMTRVFSAELQDAGVRVNAVCPGWVRTDLGGDAAPITPKEGARRVVEVSKSEETGSFFRDGEIYPW